MGAGNSPPSVPRNNGTLKLSATGNAGAALPPVSAPFALETLPDALAAGHIVITPGDNLWLIARHVYGRGTLYTVIYNANASQDSQPGSDFPRAGFFPAQTTRLSNGYRREHKIRPVAAA